MLIPGQTTTSLGIEIAAFGGFALAGASGFSLSASLSALGGFLVGAAVGGVAVERLGQHRGRLVVVAESCGREFVSVRVPRGEPGRADGNGVQSGRSRDGARVFA